MRWFAFKSSEVCRILFCPAASSSWPGLVASPLSCESDVHTRSDVFSEDDAERALACLLSRLKCILVLEVGPINRAKGSGECCKLSQQGLVRTPAEIGFWCIFRSTPQSQPNNISGSQMSVHPYVRPSTKKFFDFNEISCVGRGRRVMHDGMQYDPIRGHGQGHEPMKVGNSTIFKGYLLPHL